MPDLTRLAEVSDAESRSISAENPTGARGAGARATDGLGASAARDLGPGWKVSPNIALPADEEVTLAAIEGPGVIRHLWITVEPKRWRSIVLRMYWDDEPTPSVEVPLGDFFANGWCERSIVTSEPIAVLAGGGLNSYWPMPFRRAARITVESRRVEVPSFFYQVDYTLEPVAERAAYLHAQFRRSNPVADGVHTIVDGIAGRGHYVGTYLAWQTNSNGWWGEGEVKFNLDGDHDHPTICGTGLEDYVGGAWAFEQVPGEGYLPYTSAYLGFHQVTGVDQFARSNQRFGMYRWHIPDPIHFRSELSVTVQALGWRSGGRYLVLRDDVATVALWYQLEPHAPFPTLGTPDDLEVI